jgi:hypothetical protein
MWEADKLAGILTGAKVLALRALPDSDQKSTFGRVKMFKLGFDAPIVYEPVGGCIYCDDL